MKNALNKQELKALCELFFKAGKGGEEFESFFDKVMQGKYNRAVEIEGMELKLQEMQREIDKHMEEFDLHEKGRAARVMEDLRKIIITH